MSYSIWFNLRHLRSGHLLEGRFGADVVEDDRGWQEVARYVHRNPIRIARLGLDKSARAASRSGAITAPPAELVAERLRVLREYRWSSYPGYAVVSKAISRFEQRLEKDPQLREHLNSIQRHLSNDK